MGWGNVKVVAHEKSHVSTQKQEEAKRRQAEEQKRRALEQKQRREQEQKQMQKANYKTAASNMKSQIIRQYDGYIKVLCVIEIIVFIVLLVNELSGWGLFSFFIAFIILCVILDKRDKKIEAEDARLRSQYGIESKGFCYITTAICELEGKADDCYELTQFRHFRDNYLLKQPNGEQLIKTYYETAPQIIKAIDKIANHEQRKAIYMDIKQRYLSKCLTYIEQEEYEACKQLYIQMVHELQKKYLV